MLTKDQEKWISHLSTEKIKIIPYNPETKEVFNKIKEEIKGFLPNIDIQHRGSTALGISGQGEIDLYIPVIENDFNKNLEILISHFGKPGSVYSLKRARFVKYIDDIKIEIFLVNKESKDWLDSVKFEKYLKQNPESLKEYEKLKQKCNNLPLREYYKNKIKFINNILRRIEI